MTLSRYLTCGYIEKSGQRSWENITDARILKLHINLGDIYQDVVMISSWKYSRTYLGLCMRGLSIFLASFVFSSCSFHDLDDLYWVHAVFMIWMISTEFMQFSWFGRSLLSSCSFHDLDDLYWVHAVFMIWTISNWVHAVFMIWTISNWVHAVFMIWTISTEFMQFYYLFHCYEYDLLFEEVYMETN